MLLSVTLYCCSFKKQSTISIKFQLNVIKIEVVEPYGQEIGEIYNRYLEFSPLLGVKIVHLVDRTNLFKISNLFYDVREIILSLYSCLQGQRQTVYGGYIELAGSPFVSGKIDGLGNIWNN